jgi:hypothetical protein
LRGKIVAKLGDADLIVPHCWMSPKFLKLLKRRHENAL